MPGRGQRTPRAPGTSSDRTGWRRRCGTPTRRERYGSALPCRTGSFGPGAPRARARTRPLPRRPGPANRPALRQPGAPPAKTEAPRTASDRRRAAPRPLRPRRPGAPTSRTRKAPGMPGPSRPSWPRPQPVVPPLPRPPCRACPARAGLAAVRGRETRPRAARLLSCPAACPRPPRLRGAAGWSDSLTPRGSLPAGCAACRPCSRRGAARTPRWGRSRSSARRWC